MARTCLVGSPGQVSGAAARQLSQYRTVIPVNHGEAAFNAAPKDSPVDAAIAFAKMWDTGVEGGWKIRSRRSIFLLAAMRLAGCACHPTRVSLQCLIVDDSASFLEAATNLLEREGVTVLGVASASADALRKAQELRPDVILVDITLGHESGFDLAERLAEMDSGTPAIILISTHAEADFTDLIEQAPVAGFVAKSELSASAIRRLIRGLSSSAQRCHRRLPD